MLYRVLRRMIERAKDEPLSEEKKAEIQEKLDIFLAADKITSIQYRELSGMLNKS